MATMVCGLCGRMGIYWADLGGLSPYTRCPHCGGRNCQRPKEPEEEEAQKESEG